MLFVKLTILWDVVTVFLIVVFRMYCRTLEPIDLIVYNKTSTPFKTILGILILLALLFTFISALIWLITVLF